MNLNSLSDGFLLIINEKCVSVTWNKRSFFLFDSHSRNSKGKTGSEDAASLIKFNSKKSIELFIIENFLNRSNENVQFVLQHISFSKENNNLAATNYLANKRQMRKNDPIAKAKECKRKIDNFKKAIKEGPYFICVICNRCMHRRTVQNFDAIKYDLQYFLSVYLSTKL